jgi:hypothetical protein
MPRYATREREKKFICFTPYRGSTPASSKDLSN